MCVPGNVKLAKFKEQKSEWPLQGARAEEPGQKRARAMIGAWGLIGLQRSPMSVDRAVVRGGDAFCRSHNSARGTLSVEGVC